MHEYFLSMWSLAIEGEKQGILFYATLYTSVLLCYSTVYQLKIRSWPSTKGSLVNRNISNWGAKEWATSDQNYVVNALYKYKVGQQEYVGKRVSPWIIIASHNMKFVLEKQLNGIQKEEDGSIRVFFNPKRPQKSFLIKPGNIGLIFTLGLAVIPMLAYWLGYHV
ncbi:hypothetical protein [Thalassotalea aquiviva]|uniref:hypothetical protein n=1 Tax=Thalassotalea aquiviva TaxID=3242415 RepID=UPI00352A70A2